MSDDLLAHSLDGLPEPRPSLDLLARAQAGDRQALDDLLRRYEERIRRIVRIQLGDSTLRRNCDSMDIVQSTFCAALPRMQDFHPRNAASLLHWLAVIALNQVRDAHDAQHTLKRDIGREVELDGLTSDEAIEDRSNTGEADPARRASLNEIRELLDSEVTRLPEDQRRVVILRDYCGDDWHSIAHELARTDGAARELHQRAWINLRRALRPKLIGRERTDLPSGDLR
jgi:RNA polymerase sigma factor (sigma-70 family)